MSGGGASAPGDPGSLRYDDANGWGNLMFLDRDGPWVTETVKSKITDKGGVLYLRVEKHA